MAKQKITTEQISTASSAWTSWTPTISAATGTITTSSGTGKYTQIGKTVHFYAALTITNNGTGSGVIISTVPVSGAAADGTSVGGGRAGAVSGKQVNVRIESTGTRFYVLNYDNSYPAASGEILRISGTYEAA